MICLNVVIIMRDKCFGCGNKLEEEKIFNLLPDDESNQLCSRCFKMKNYGEYSNISDTIVFDKIFKTINKSNDLVVWVADIMDLNLDIISNKYDIKNDIILVLSKCDLLPKSVKEYKLMNYLEEYNLNVVDVVFTSSMKNYNFDTLYSKIEKYKKSKNVYVTGLANAGKSTLINKMIKNYSDYTAFVTTSIMPSTTINFININLSDDLMLIDTPGIIDDGSILNEVSIKDLKKITPKKEVKPRTFQIKSTQAILIDEYARIDYNSEYSNSLTIYLSNTIKVDSINKIKNPRLNDLQQHNIHVLANQDILIKGLCFIKVVKECDLVVYTIKGVKVDIRKKMI